MASIGHFSHSTTITRRWADRRVNVTTPLWAITFAFTDVVDQGYASKATVLVVSSKGLRPLAGLDHA